jgi:nitrogenase molybdenum-iron protein NifN
MLSDYADRLDGPTWDTFHRIPKGGTPLEQLYRLGGARTCLELTSIYEPARTGGGLLADRFGVRHVRLPMPIGVKLTDRFTRELEAISGRSLPYRHAAERGRLIDSYVDAHKYVFDKRAVLFGHEDLVVSLSAFLAEVGMIPALIASGGGNAGRLRRAVLSAAPELEGHTRILGGVDFAEIEEAAVQVQADLLIGSSNGYRLSRQLGVPLVRVGLPIHDRLGAARVMHVGYRGTQQLFDRIVNALLEARQDGDPTGYTHM